MRGGRDRPFEPLFRAWLLATVGLSVVALPRASAQPAARCRVWHQVPSPPVQGGALGDASATSATDIWAVGGNGYTPIIEHWDGSAWTLDPSPQSRGALGGVAAVASDDAWAVGILEQGTGVALVEHWDGTAWSRYPAPSPGQEDYLDGVSAISADDIWAAGFYMASDGDLKGLAEHYDGTAWSVVPMDDVSSLANVMEGVHAVASDDVWAVGYQEVSFSVNQALAEHWDGTSWTAVPMVLPPPSIGNSFNDVSASSATDVWAVGNYGGQYLPLMEHWDGAVWKRYTAPGAQRSWGVVAISPLDAWAGGSGGPTPASWHWDGTIWSYVPAPRVGTVSSIAGLVASSDRDIWAVGTYTPAQGGNLQPLTLYSRGGCH